MEKEEVMRTCKLEKCNTKHRARGYCNKHYKRRMRYGSPHITHMLWNYGRTCIIDGCEQKATHKHMCTMHYRRLERRGTTGSPEREKAEYIGGPLDSYGYVVLAGHHSHPNSDKTGRIKEHTLVMAEKLGRPLRKKETVHHRNGIRHDNRPENLELWASRHPPGQRVTDLVAFARKILDDHDPQYEITRTFMEAGRG